MAWLLGQGPTSQRLEYCVQGGPWTMKERKLASGDGHKESKPSYHTLACTRDHLPSINVQRSPSTMEEIMSSHLNGKAKPCDVSWHPSWLWYHECLSGAPWCWAQQQNSPSSVANVLPPLQNTQPESSEDRCCMPLVEGQPWRGPASLLVASGFLWS